MSKVKVDKTNIKSLGWDLSVTHYSNTDRDTYPADVMAIYKGLQHILKNSPSVSKNNTLSNLMNLDDIYVIGTSSVMRDNEHRIDGSCDSDDITLLVEAVSNTAIYITTHYHESRGFVPLIIISKDIMDKVIDKTKFEMHDIYIVNLNDRNSCIERTGKSSTDISVMVFPSAPKNWFVEMLTAYEFYDQSSVNNAKLNSMIPIKILRNSPIMGGSNDSIPKSKITL